MSKTKVFIPRFPELDELCDGVVLLMKQSGLTQKELAENLGVNQSDIAKVLKPKKYYKEFPDKYHFLSNIIRIIIDSKLGERGLELSSELLGVKLNDTRVDLIFDGKKPTVHRQIPTKRVG